ELAAACEELGQGLFALRALEEVFLCHLLPGKGPAGGGQPVALPRIRLLLGEQRLSCLDPLLPGDHLVAKNFGHISPPFSATSSRPRYRAPSPFRGSSSCSKARAASPPGSPDPSRIRSRARRVSR